MNTASEAKLIPAPLDEKNLTTDWIEEAFDNYSCSCGGKRNNVYTGIVEDCPVVGGKMIFNHCYSSLK